jgi:Ca2+-binding RTX toxin-like protein
MAKYNLGNGNDRLYATNFDDEIYGNGGADTLYALDGNDFVNGGAGDDAIAGGRGNDWLLGGEGNDTLNGEDGNDTLRDQAGNDTYYGGNDDDTLEGGIGDDHLYGGAGNDTMKLVGSGHAWMYGGKNNDIYDLGTASLDHERPSIYENAGEGYDAVRLGAGWGGVIDSYTLPANVEELQLPEGLRDSYYENGAFHLAVRDAYGNDLDNVMIGSAGEDRLFGGKGNDTLVGNGHADMLSGGEGQDTLIDSTGVATLIGGSSDDTYLVTSTGPYGSGNIVEYAGEGYDTLKFTGPSVTMAPQVERLMLMSSSGSQAFGNELVNLVNGSAGADEIHGGGGDDSLYGYDGADSLFGDAGNDLLAAGPGDDSLVGGSGNDVLAGEADQDELWGNAGADRLEGGDGNDLLAGGTGSDELTGGADSDTFSFAGVSDSPWNQRDRIMDFQPGVDTIDLHACDAQPGTAGLQNWHLVPAFTGIAGELMFSATPSSTLVFGDTNGDKLVDFTIELMGTPILSLADFDGVW